MAEGKRGVRVFGWYIRRDLAVFSVLFVVSGLGIGVGLLPAEWSLWERVLAGLAMGVGAMIALFAPRMIGGEDYD